MKSRIGYVCEKCGHIHLKVRTLRQKILLVPKYILFVFLGLMVVFGMLATYNLTISMAYPQESEASAVGGFQSLFTKYQSNFFSSNEKQELKNIAFDLSSGCDSDICRVQKIYEYLEPQSIYSNPSGVFKYEVGTDLNPIDIWNEKSGDCDEMSYLMFSLLKSIGIKSDLQCSNNHCWLIVKTEGKQIIADLTKHHYEVLE